MVFEDTIHVAAHPHQVHAYVSDLVNLPAWDPATTGVRKVSSGPLDVGTRYEVAMRFLGLPATMDYAVVEHAPGTRTVLRGTANGTVATDTIETTMTATGCCVRWRAEIRLPWPLSWLDGVVVRLFAPTIRAAVDGLRRALGKLETRVATHAAADAAPMAAATNGISGHA